MNFSYRNIFFKKGVWVFYVMVASSFFLIAQGGLPSMSGEWTKISIPERDRNGLLIWQLYGDRAKIRSDGHMEIQGLSVHTYNGTNVDWTLSTSSCILNQKTREAVSEAPVKIFNSQMEIQGDGFHWLSNENRFIIRQSVRVIIQGGFTRGGEL